MTAEDRRLRDLIALLKRVVAPCDGADDHAWRKCRRCAAVHGIEMRFGLTMRLLQVGIDELEALLSPEGTTPDEETPEDTRQSSGLVKGNFYGKGLEVRVERGALVIRIGAQVLAHSASYAEWANPFNEELDDYIRTFAITDAEEFAKDVRHAMLNEREDGSSPLSGFLDKMMEAAIDDGSLACEYEQTIKHGTTAPSEVWATEPPLLQNAGATPSEEGAPVGAHDSSSSVTEETRQSSASEAPPRRAGHDAPHWIDRVASDIRDLNPYYHDFEAEVAKMIRSALPTDGEGRAAVAQKESRAGTRAGSRFLPELEMVCRNCGHIADVTPRFDPPGSTPRERTQDDGH